MPTAGRTIGVLYPGEMGTAVARRLQAAGGRVLTLLDGRGAQTRSNACNSGISAAADPADFMAQCDLLLSLVPQDAAEPVARFAASHARTRETLPIYVDCNSLSPGKKKEIGTLWEKSGGFFADGVFIGGAAMLDTKTRLVLSGPAAGAAAGVLSPALALEVLDGETGDAAALKMCFAEFNKGLVALFIEIAAVSFKSGSHAALCRCLRDFYPETYDTVERLLASYPRHCGRRLLEMGEIAAFIESLGQTPLMARAAETLLRVLDEALRTAPDGGAGPNADPKVVLAAILKKGNFLQ